MPAGQPKRRPAGDGMDAEMDDPELMFEMTTGHHLGDCQCACDHVVYSPTTYTTCLQIVGPAEIAILSISNCHDFDDKDLHLRVNVNRAPFYAPMISGNVSLACYSDDKAKINLKESPVELNKHGETLKDTDNKGLYKLPWKYLYGHSYPTVRDNFQSICPSSSGFYEITGTAAHLTAVDLPSAMPKRKNFKMELVRVGDHLVCKEFRIHVLKKVLGVA